MDFLAWLWPLGALSGTLMMTGSALIIACRMIYAEDDGSQETQACPPHIRRRRRINLMLVLVGTLGFWILTGSLILAILID